MQSQYGRALTPREQEVIELLSIGLTNEEIAHRLGISLEGVKYHVSEILQRLGVENRHDAVAVHLRTGRNGWLAALAPVMFLRKLPFAWFPKATATALLTAAAAGITLLAWGVITASDDAATTTGCTIGQTVGDAANCAPSVAQADAGADAITAISAGGDHTCALKDGGVWCWGDNWAGQLGNGSVCQPQPPGVVPCVGAAVPVGVLGLPSGVSAISADGSHTCVVKDGGVWCWGAGGKDTCLSTEPGREPDFCVDTAPAAVSGLASGVSDISGSCALKEGGVWCWGGGGDPSTRAAGAMGGSVASGVSAISAGVVHSCALEDGGVWCWGSNSSGQLGNNSTTDSAVPVPVSGLTSGVSAISFGDGYSCALKGSGVWCWGANGKGQLGNDSTADSPVPVAVSGLASGVSAITVGQDHSCAVKDDGIWCWGGNAVGQLGNNSTTGYSDVPVRVQFTPPSAGDTATAPDAKPPPSQPSRGSADHRAAYVLGGTSAAVLAVVVAGVWAVRRRRPSTSP